MFEPEHIRAIAKELSANDTGDTGGHQAGILIPKNPEILSFFPALDRKTKNPRHHIVFHGEDGTRWEFAFIYYNNKFFGGTRNEYRLTHMTNYIRSHNLKPGDKIILRHEDGGKRYVACRRAKPVMSGSGKIKLGSSWRIIKI